MCRFSEQTLKSWERAASENEEQRISNSIRMVKDAIDSSEDLKHIRNKIEIFIQGSYKNNTNVRANSDIDICVMLKNPFYSIYPDYYDRTDYGFTKSEYGFRDYKEDLFKALRNKFPETKIGNKSLKIESNSYRVEIDAIPSIQLRNYKAINSHDSDSFIEGIKFISNSGDAIINYPKEHVKNSIQKNENTQRRYKRLVRVVKRIRHQMIKDGESVDGSISSFLLECLIWNVPNPYIQTDDTKERLRKTLAFLYHKTKEESNCHDWTEASGLLPLFSNSRKWNINKTNHFILQMWRYLEFK